MEKRISRLTGLFSLALILSGCINRQQPSAPVEPAQSSPPKTSPQKPETPPAPPPVLVPLPPKFHTINWEASVSPLIAQMLHSTGVTPDSVLMVAGVRNNTNGSIQRTKVTSAVTSTLASQTQFRLVTTEQLAAARQSLGLSQEDSLATRSKAIGLARAVNAQAVLYTTLNGNVKNPEMEMQLLSVRSGEIIWSGRSVARY